MAVNVLNSTIGIQRQFARPLKQEFDLQKNEFLQGRFPPTHAVLNLKTFGFPEMDSDILVDHIFSNIESTPRLQAIALALRSSTQGLAKVFELRAHWIREFRHAYPQISANAMYDFWGIKRPDGHQDQTHADLVTAISEGSARVIWFSNTLCSLLTDQGHRLQVRYKNELGDMSAPRVNTSKVIDNSDRIIPDDKEFESWGSQSFPAN
jgi:hypothetical protein